MANADLELLLAQAWRVRQAHFPPTLGADNPRRTRALSLTGSDCALDCAHCGRHYLAAMLPLAGLSRDDPRLVAADSLLISGGCDARGRVPVTARLEQVAALRPGQRLNWHTGLIGEEEVRAIAPLVDTASFDLVGDDETIAEVYGLPATVEDYRESYRLLRRYVPVVPHITIGLRGGRLSGERAALRLLHEEGAAGIVFLVLIPTRGTRFAAVSPPPVEEVARLLAEARLAFPDTPLSLGCMRPGGPYRRALDPLAVRAGVNRIVKPGAATVEFAASLGLQVEATEECCVLALTPSLRPPTADSLLPPSVFTLAGIRRSVARLRREVRGRAGLKAVFSRGPAPATPAEGSAAPQTPRKRPRREVLYPQPSPAASKAGDLCGSGSRRRPRRRGGWGAEAVPTAAAPLRGEPEGTGTVPSAGGVGDRSPPQKDCLRPGIPAGLAEEKVRTIRVSAGTEVVLGLRQRPMEAAPTTAYLMLDGGGCAMACTFCAQSRGSRAREDALSRIVWPAHPLEAVLAALERAPEVLGRVCFQVTVHRGALDQVRAMVQAVRKHTSRPISVAIRPPDVAGIGELLDAGVDAVGLGLDCAGERVYREVKGAGWRRMLALVEEACRRFPGRVRVHLMAGLGETEGELCRTMQQVYDWGGAVGLFAFTPVRGTPLAARPQPPLDGYRRLQAARFLLHRGLARVEQFRFDEAGRLVDLGRPDLPALLAGGEAFRTTGCPDCNRPFYNERPGGTMYNYPRPLGAAEVEQAIADMASGQLPAFSHPAPADC